MAERKSLLTRYGIPLNHLDFQYVKDCNDPREMERIVHILQSGEEGFYPDLTKCAEDKLRLLKPNSRLFRSEVQILRGDAVTDADVQPIKEFSRQARDKDRRLAAVKCEDDCLAPIRNVGKINLNNTDKTGENKNITSTSNQNNTNKTSGKKIASTDYRKWDSYDPDEEILRMDLAEEREQEEVERKTRLIAKNFSQTPLIEEIKEEEQRIKKLTDIERENLAEEYRLRGNEYFRAKEYDSALKEYTRGITLNPEKDAAVYNNRAITYMKLKKYADAINDCQKCLSIEPNNIKALYRLGQSNMESGFKEKALEIFSKVLALDPNHTNAKNFVQTLRNQIPEKAPSNATRLQIVEGPTQISASSQNTSESLQQSKPMKTKKITIKKKVENTVSEAKDYDLASLVRPKEIVPNKLMDTAANLMGKTHVSDNKKDTNSGAATITNDNDDKDIQLRLPMLNQTTNLNLSKPLIEEL